MQPWNVLKIPRDKAAGQSSLFAVFDAASDNAGADDLPAAVMNITEWPEQELLANEKSALGFYIAGIHLTDSRIS